MHCETEDRRERTFAQGTMHGQRSDGQAGERNREQRVAAMDEESEQDHSTGRGQRFDRPARR